MSDKHNNIKDRILEVLKGLTPEERKLFGEVLRVERIHLNEKSPEMSHMKGELLKIVRQVIQ